eukprot:12408630-Prorocentrum_lima.AAC.1
MGHLQKCVEGGLKNEQGSCGLLHDAFGKPWKCRVTGIILRHGIAIEEEAPTRVFLGMVVEVVEEKL